MPGHYKTKAQVLAKKRIAKKKVEAKKTAFKKGVGTSVTNLKKAAKTVTKGASDVVKAGGKVGKRIATSKKLRAGLKAGASAATGLTALRALKKRKKK